MIGDVERAPLMRTSVRRFQAVSGVLVGGVAADDEDGGGGLGVALRGGAAGAAG